MNALKRVGICLVVCMIASFFAIGFQVWSDLSTREDEVLTYTRLAMKDALVNIQTTEQEGFNYAKIAYSKDKYTEYLKTILNQSTNDENMKLISSFLDANANASAGDELFRPIQYGMTYVDKELFESSFLSSLNTLVATNYPKEFGTSDGAISFTTRAPNAVVINDVNFNIDGPKVGTLNLTGNGAVDDAIYRSLYGTDVMAETALVKDLGFGSSALNFYVYYDITVDIAWSSASTNQLMTRNFFTNLASAKLNSFASDNQVSADPNHIKYTPSINGSQQYLYIPGKTITYSYRYVLLN